MNISNYLKTKIIDSILRNIAFVPSTQLYVALYITDPTDLDVGIEAVGVEGASYSRQLITFDADVLGLTQNSNDIAFPVASSNWGSIAYIGIKDALTNGNLLYHSELITHRNITDATQLVFLKGQIDFSLT